MAESYIQITPEDFAKTVLGTPNLVVVQFSVEQSTACKIQDPEFAVISQEFANKATFVKVNVQGQDTFTSQWHIDSVPTLVFFKNGSEIYRITGIVMRNRLRRQLEGVLLANENEQPTS